MSGTSSFFAGPDVLGAAGVDVGAALDVFERGEEQVVFGDADLLGELLRGGGEDDGGFEMSGIFLTASRSSETMEPCGKVLVRPSGFQSSLSATMIWPSSRP